MSNPDRQFLPYKNKKLSHFARCESGFAAEMMSEMRGIGKSEQIGDFRDGHISFFEQFAGAFDALVDDVLVRRVAG